MLTNYLCLLKTILALAGFQLPHWSPKLTGVAVDEIGQRLEQQFYHTSILELLPLSWKAESATVAAFLIHQNFFSRHLWKRERGTFNHQETRNNNRDSVQLLVSCGGRRRPADGLRQQHVRTIRLLVWDTLEDFTAILTSNVGQGKQHVTPTWRGQIITG